MAELPKIAVPDNAKSAVIAPGSNGNSVTFRDANNNPVGRPIILGIEGANFVLSKNRESDLNLYASKTVTARDKQFEVEITNNSSNTVIVHGTSPKTHIHVHEGKVDLIMGPTKLSPNAAYDPATGITALNKPEIEIKNNRPTLTGRMMCTIDASAYEIKQPGADTQSLVINTKDGAHNKALPIATAEVGGKINVKIRAEDKDPLYTMNGAKSLAETQSQLDSVREGVIRNLRETLPKDEARQAIEIKKRENGGGGMSSLDGEDRLRAAMAGIGELGEATGKITVPSEGSSSRNFHVTVNPLDLDKSNSRT